MCNCCVCICHSTNWDFRQCGTNLGKIRMQISSEQSQIPLREFRILIFHGCFLTSKCYERIYLKCCWPFDQTLTMGGFLDYCGQSFWEFCSQDIKLFMVLIIYICFLQDKMLLTCCILSPQKCLCAPVCVCIVCVCVCTRVWSLIILNRDHNLLRYSSGQIRIPTMPRTIGQGQSPRFALWHIYIYNTIYTCVRG